MSERELFDLIGGVKNNRLSKRQFLMRVAAFGLSAPIAHQLLVHYGAVAQAQGLTPSAKPAGGGGELNMIVWQAPTLLNPHFAAGMKDVDASRIFYEPLASFDADGGLVPILASEIPTAANGGLTADGRSVTWKLRRDVEWHDGHPFSADDVVFTWEYAKDPLTAAITNGSYAGVTVKKVDDFTVRLEFPRPNPFWADAFVGVRGMVLPRHVFSRYIGDKSRDAPANVMPVGTGPFKIVEFKPGDLVRAEINRRYHVPGRPYFDKLHLKGGGDAVSAARAVLQTGQYDYAWNLLVDDDILRRLESGGKGRIEYTINNSPEFMQLNPTDPRREVDGERSSAKTRHPILSDPLVREALSLLIDRAAIRENILGPAAEATGNCLSAPAQYRSQALQWKFDPERANALLEKAGWSRGDGGVRRKDGQLLKLEFQTAVNSPRQKIQQMFKQACQKAGIEIDLKAIPGSVFFSSDPANPDTFSRFSTDIQMYQSPMLQADPGSWMSQFCSWEIAGQHNKYLGRNKSRWWSEQYDALHRQSQTELDPVKRAALFIAMNDLVAADHTVLTIANRKKVTGFAKNIKAPMTGWDADTSALAEWTKDA